jgi:hypothetical protein
MTIFVTGGYLPPQPSFFSAGLEEAEAFKAAAVPLQASPSRSNRPNTQPPASAARVEAAVAPTLKPPLLIHDIPEETFELKSIVYAEATGGISGELLAELVAETLFIAIKRSVTIPVPTGTDSQEVIRYNQNKADYIATQVHGILRDAEFEEEEYEKAGEVAEEWILRILAQPGKTAAVLNDEILTYVPQHVIRSIARVVPASDQAIINAIARGVMSGVARA